MSLVQHSITDLVPDSERTIQPEPGVTKVPLEAMASVALASSAIPALSAAQKSGPNTFVTEEKAAEHSSKQVEQQLQERLEFEKVAGAIQRANLEQARRVGDSLRHAYEALLTHMAQPCLLLDMNGRITRWNPALERWSGITPETAQHRMLPDLIVPSALAALTSAQLTLLKMSPSETDQNVTLQDRLEIFPERFAAHLTLLPLYRIPGCLEAILILIEPQVTPL
jgi:PAS domain-containing protein